jgi:hypothetical protein
MNGFTLSVAAAALILIPSLAPAQCGGNSCSVGAFGTGGTSSDGKAQGFRLTFPSTMFPGATFSNTGNFDAGRLSISDGIGSTSGTFRQNPTPTVRGNASGIFGDWSGQCDIEDFPDNC